MITQQKSGLMYTALVSYFKYHLDIQGNTSNILMLQSSVHLERYELEVEIRTFSLTKVS